MDALTNRYDFVFLFDVRDGNPNGDPDANSYPRMDPETGIGLVTDVALKRRVRNFVAIAKDDKPPFEIYLKDRSILNRQHLRAHAALGLEIEEGTSRPSLDKVEAARQWMCRNFYDVRTFGAVMSTGVNCGQVRGPVQMTFARSVCPIAPVEHAIFRSAVMTEAEADRQGGENRTLVRRTTIPYALYVCHGFISPHFARQTGFSEGDLDLFWNALENLFEMDRSSSRGEMTTQGLFVFRHESHLGNAPAHSLFRRVTVQSRRDPGGIPRGIEDYRVEADSHKLPLGVEMIARVSPRGI